jgi:hypothetical protein
MYTYSTGEKINMLDQVKVGLFGIEFPGTVVYIQGLSVQNEKFKWCEKDNLEGIIVEWQDPDIPNSYLVLFENIREKTANYIQLNNWDDEDLVFVGRDPENFR